MVFELVWPQSFSDGTTEWTTEWMNELLLSDIALLAQRKTNVWGIQTISCILWYNDSTVIDLLFRHGSFIIFALKDKTFPQNVSDIHNLLKVGLAS